MNVIAVGDEAAVRLAIFLGLFSIFAFLERLYPKRPTGLWRERWLNNLSLSAINTLCLRFLAPWSGTVFALLVMERAVSPLAIHAWPLSISVLVFVVAFDLTIYFQHRLFHAFNPLWVFHRVHHTDVEYDVTTGNRFHPVSILVSMVIKLALVMALGPVPVAVLVAEVLLNATSMFNHSNIRLPVRLERGLRYVIVTPDMHRIHHSIAEAEQGANFGFNFSCWDRLFGTYREQAESPQHTMLIGIIGFDRDWSVRLDKLLLQPFRSRE